MKTRKATVAGRFYLGTKDELSIQLSQILRKEDESINRDLAQKQIIGAVVPHAGYMFSAYQAIHFFELLKASDEQFDTFFIVNPNHTGYGAEIALDENDFWETPLGKTEIDKDFYDFLDFSESASAHKFEHSGEVMLPLLQYSIEYDFKIVPITLSKQNPENARFIASEIFKANKFLNKKICLIASSDFSHFVHPDEGKRLDKFVIDEILNLNSDGVYKEVRDKDISVCGYGPIMTLIEYSKMVSDDPQTKILKIGHSGEVIPSDEVVDYVSILFYEN
ncbi:MAG: AmmeMemoRadiSam system protein B [Desulfobacula sp.]|uniref:AmmeMemoRadiSam system protein B n=1 Tax=Desulfobacula sp. TaxID=2593537 RepID=UPI0025C45801|nr:AmmeMemoRadiSam system protein B [Desulfobacula sp.]MCD4719997.1 AmmeMemoRadiSam system protein B [Desulfobacula sp.]